MTELPPHLTALLESARTAHEPSDADRERVFGALQVSLGAAAVAAAVSQTSVVAAGASSTPSLVPGAASAAGFAAKWWVIGALAVGSSGIWAWWPESSPRTSAPSASRGSSELAVAPIFAPTAEHPAPQRDRKVVAPDTLTAPAQGPEAQRVARAQTPELAAPESTPAKAPRPSVKAVRSVARQVHGGTHTAASPAVTKSEGASSVAVSEVQSSPSHQGELALVRATLTALRDRRAKDALALLDEHERQYPQGAMAHERSGLRAVALCDAGERERGLREQAAFLRADASSTLAQRVRHACPTGDAR